MQFTIYRYLIKHPIQKKVVKYWIEINLPVPSFFKLQLANEIHAEMIIRLMGVVIKDGALTEDKARKVHFDLGKEIATQVEDLLSIAPNDARSLSTIIDFLHNLLFISGKKIIKSSKDQAVSHWHSCQLSGQLANLKNDGGPYYCHLYQEMYKGVLHGINPNAKANNLEITQSQGCDYCELQTWIEEGT